MFDKTKLFIKQNRALFENNDFTTIVRNASKENVLWDLLNFLYNQAHLDPLMYMESIPSGMFTDTDIPTIKIPANIKSVATNGVSKCKVKSIIVESADTILGEGSLQNNNSLSAFVFPEGTVVIPRNVLYGCRTLNKVIIPESTLRVKVNAFDETGSDLKIVTPFRAEKNKKLTIPSSEIDFYKQHLRFSHAPKEAANEVQE